MATVSPNLATAAKSDPSVSNSGGTKAVRRSPAARQRIARYNGPRAPRAFIPIPNKQPSVPKLSGASQAVSLVFNHLPASQSAIFHLLNRCTRQMSTGGSNPPSQPFLNRPAQEGAPLPVWN